MAFLSWLPISAVYEVHAEYESGEKSAQNWSDHSSPQVSYLMFRSLSAAVTQLIPEARPGPAGVFVGAGSAALLGLLVFELVRTHVRAGDSTVFDFATSVALALSLTMVAPITIFTIPKINLYFGFISPTSYHNPTMVLLKPLALLLFVALVHSLSNGVQRWYSYLYLAMLCALTTFAKPSYTLCVLPALALFVGAQRLMENSVDRRLLFFAVTVPSMVVLVWQFFYTYGGLEQTDVALAPLQVMGQFGSPLAKFILSVAFPACVYILFFRQATRDGGLNFAWLAFAIAVLYSYLLASSDAQANLGDWIWCAQVTLFILFVASVIFLLRQAKSESLKSTAETGGRVLLCAVVYSLHLACGIVFLAAHIKPLSSMWVGRVIFT